MAIVLLWLRSAWPRETADHRPSPGAWRFNDRPDDLALSRLPCQGGADEDGVVGDESAAPGAVAGATPERPGTNQAGLQHARACGSSGSAGVRRSSKRKAEREE